MKYRNKIVASFCFIFLAACQAPVTIVEPVTPVDSVEIAEAPAWPSLAALAQKDFNGRDLRVGEVLASTNSYTRYYITYTSGELTISGVMNVPRGTGPFPLLVLNHGYIDPAIYTNGRGLKREQDYLAQRGYVVIHPDYRNHAHSDRVENIEQDFRLGYVEDVINAVLAARASGLAYIDASRVGMLGHSMGGGVTQAILVVRPDLVDAAMLYAPVSADARDNFKKWTTSRPEVAAEIIASHGAPDSNQKFWDSVSPISMVDAIVAPIMFNHGDADESVPLEWSQRFHDTLIAAGKTSTLHIYPGEPHEFIKAWPLVMQRTVDFFDLHLKQQPGA